MTVDLAPIRFPPGLPGGAAETACGTLWAAGGRTPIEDSLEGSREDVAPPPAAVARAETMVEILGILIMLAIALSALWIAIRRRR